MTARGQKFRERIAVSALEMAPEIRLNTPHCSHGKTDMPREEAHPNGHTELFPFTLELQTCPGLGVRAEAQAERHSPDGKGPL